MTRHPRPLCFPLAALLLCVAPAWGQALNLDLGAQGGSTTRVIVQLVALVTVLSVAPSILRMVTSFVRITIVLSFLRTALGAQQTPPNMVLVALALFLTAFIMAPTFQQAWDNGLSR